MTTYLNDARLSPSGTSNVRQPVLQVLVNGTPITGEIKASVTNVGHFHADTFDVEFALSNKTYDLAYWSNQKTPIELDIQIGLRTTNDYGPQNVPITWQSMIIGQVDHMSAHLGTRTIHMEGRDLSARLIDLKLQDAFPNKTSSEVAILLAGRVNLLTSVTATNTLTGVYYAGDHDTLTNDNFSKTTTAWDLLTHLAQMEQFDIFVKGNTLYFQPLVDPAKDTSPPWLVRYVNPTLKENVSSGSTITGNELSLQRSLTLAKDVVVVVTSWNSGTAKKIKATYPSSSSHSLHSAKSTLQSYVFNVPNLRDTNEALQQAQAFYKDIVKHERIVEWHEPGDLTLTPRNMVVLTGTGSSWDATYFIDTITRSIGFEEGFSMNIRAKNQSTQSQVTVG